MHACCMLSVACCPLHVACCLLASQAYYGVGSWDATGVVYRLLLLIIASYAPLGPFMIFNMWGNRKVSFKKRDNAAMPAPAPPKGESVPKPVRRICVYSARPLSAVYCTVCPYLRSLAPAPCAYPYACVPMLFAPALARVFFRSAWPMRTHRPPCVGGVIAVWPR